jgi:hypothetical protein
MTRVSGFESWSLKKVRACSKKEGLKDIRSSIFTSVIDFFWVIDPVTVVPRNLIAWNPRFGWILEVPTTF